MCPQETTGYTLACKPPEHPDNPALRTGLYRLPGAGEVKGWIRARIGGDGSLHQVRPGVCHKGRDGDYSGTHSVGEFITNYGIPERLHSDQGRCFESAVVKELCSLLGIVKSKTSPYHPQGNGMTERFNRTLLSMLGTLEPHQKVNWATHLQALTHAYKSSQHEATGYTPFYLMFLREPRLSVDLIVGQRVQETEESRPQSVYVEQLRRHLQDACERVSLATQKAQEKQKSTYDRKVDDKALQPGDKVLVANRTPRGKCKLRDKWEEVPYLVMKQMGDLPVYTVQQCGSERTRNLHRNLLTICPFETEEVTVGTIIPSQVQLEDGETGHQPGIIPPPQLFQDAEAERQSRFPPPRQPFREEKEQPRLVRRRRVVFRVSESSSSDSADSASGVSIDCSSSSGTSGSPNPERATVVRTRRHPRSQLPLLPPPQFRDEEEWPQPMRRGRMGFEVPGPSSNDSTDSDSEAPTRCWSPSNTCRSDQDRTPVMTCRRPRRIIRPPRRYRDCL